MPQPLTVTQAAAILKVSRSRVHALIRQKRIQANRQGHQLVISPMQLLKLQGRKNGRPRKGQAPREVKEDYGDTIVELGRRIRHAIWREYTRVPAELHPAVAPKFIQYATQLQKSGTIPDWWEDAEDTEERRPAKSRGTDLEF